MNDIEYLKTIVPQSPHLYKPGWSEQRRKMILYDIEDGKQVSVCVDVWVRPLWLLKEEAKMWEKMKL